MAEQNQQQKPRRRRRRGKRRGKGKSPNQPQVKAEVSHDPYDDAAHIRAIKSQKEETKRVEYEVTKSLDILLPKILSPRDFEILDWMIETTGSTKAELVKQILRVAIVKERRAYREAKGGGGATSTNLPGLLNRM